MKYLKFNQSLVILFVLLTFASPKSRATSMEARLLPDKDNLIGHPVFNIVLDNTGYVWISSRAGINRYDGNSIKHYSLSNSEIVSDHDGRQIYLRWDKYKNLLYAFTNKGKVYSYDIYRDNFTLCPIEETEDDIFYTKDDLLIDKDEMMWLASTNGLHCFNLSENKRNSFLNGTKINTLVELTDNLLALGTTKGLLFFDRKTHKISEQSACKDKNITTLHFDTVENHLWIGTFNSGTFVMDLNSKELLKKKSLLELPNTPVRAIKTFGSSFLVGLDGSGVYIVDLKEDKSSLLFSDKDGVLNGNGVYDILVDNKNIWTVTYSGGVSIVKIHNDFNWIQSIPYIRQSLIDNHVNSILEDQSGNMWYATNSGVSKYDIKKDEWSHFFEQENSFLTLCEDRNQNIWCGGYGIGIYFINSRTGNFRHISSLQGNSEADCIYASCMDADGDLWFGGLFNPLTMLSFKSNYTEQTTYDIRLVNSISPIGNDSLFIGTTNGFYILDKSTKEFKHYFSDAEGYKIKSNTYVYSGLIHGRNIWFGTDGGGLNCYNLETEKVENFSTYDGLPSNFIYGILQDENVFWISTANGLFCFDPVGKTIVSTMYELPVKEFLFMSYTHLKDGDMAFGSREGVIIFNPKTTLKEKTSSNLHFTDFKLSYKSIIPSENPKILPEPIDDVAKITLKHNQNTFSFSFISVDLYDADHYVYDYKLDGFDQDWIPKGRLLTASYTNVPPGKYTFHVRCFGNDGQLLSERQIAVQINQPFWNTIWAWIVYFILLGFIIYWILQYYSNKLQKEQSEEKIDFFINVAHDIRTPLSLIMAPINDLEKEPALSGTGKNNVRLARKNGEKLLSIINQLLDFQKEKFAPSDLNIQLADFSEYIKEQIDRFEPLAHSKGIYIEVDLPSESVFIETDFDKVDRIIDNLLSNAIKYTEANGEIRLKLHVKDDKLTLEIADSGIGISKKEQKKIFKQFYRAKNAANSKESGSGIGLVYTRRLVRILGGDLSFTSKENEGTSFYLSLPVKKSALSPANRTIFKTDEKTTVYNTIPNQNSPKSGYRILLVEDNDDLRLYLSSSLSNEYFVHSVASAEDALQYLETNSVDIVLSDIMMGSMRGDELCKVLKNDIKTSHILVLLITALSDKGDMITGLECGADDFITKPFDIEVLRIKLKNFLQMRARLQSHLLSVKDLNEKKSENESGEKGIDETFIEKCISIVLENIANFDFSINDLCHELAMSRTLVYEKLKALTNQAPNEFIRTIRLKRAKELLIQKYPVQDVAEMTGFSDSKYFSTVFKKYYGVNPSKIREK